MTLEKAILNNPYDKNRGNISAYIRYLRYNVDGFYNMSSKEVREKLENYLKKNLTKDLTNVYEFGERLKQLKGAD